MVLFSFRRKAGAAPKWLYYLPQAGKKMKGRTVGAGIRIMLISTKKHLTIS